MTGSVRRIANLLGAGYPPVALPENAHEEGLDAIDPLLAVLPRIGAFAVHAKLGYAPPQVDVVEGQAQSFNTLAELGEHHRHQVVALSVHIAKSRADENTNLSLRIAHVATTPGRETTLAEPGLVESRRA